MRLQSLEGVHTRPTLGRAKEGIFSAIHFVLPGARVLDLYAGNGQMGLEALSRGSEICYFVEDSAEAVKVIRNNVNHTGLQEQSRVRRSDVQAFLARTTMQFDIIFADPPYFIDVFPSLLGDLAPLCAPGATVLCESEKDAEFPQTMDGLTLQKQYHYGSAMISRYQMTDSDD